MFSKSSYLHPPQVSQSLQSRGSTSAADLIIGAEILLHDHHHHQHQHQHQQDMLSGQYLNANAPFLEASTLYNQDVGGINEDPNSALANTFSRKLTGKKDRHSKIVTSQGPRDRRVRLSIGIARKFFDLQEMLGFDKPSKTLEWLLTKSKVAIKDLVHTKKSSSARSTSSPSECVVLNGEAFEDGSCLSRADSNRKSVLMNAKKCKGAKDPTQNASTLAKESRAKARARARERTKEKMCIKKLNESRNMGSNLNHSVPIQRNNLFEVCKPSASSNSQPILHCPIINEATAATTEDLIQESNVIKRMLRHHPSFFGFHCSIQSPNVNENWDISSLTTQSNFCDILDQHKFINRSSNM